MIHRALAIISMTALLMVGGQSYAAPENGKLESVAMSPRLQTLFAKTKQVCFGRYAMEVPAEANLGSGAQYFSRERATLHPAWIHANMRTEVVAADKASLSDEEAIVLWDKLLEGVRFRVNAPPTQTGDMTDHNGVVATGSPKIQAP
ncbi:hypothetical protein ASL20_24770 [Cupriavidus necator]|uniref:T6SS immunity protein Tli4 family protein n=1 Tax=Cupriavidus necator TaxID=106590 RepID=UPI000735BE60|nr:T6SS immunity protein Tli4 family protein [Cupriavidus necator]KUE86085.1 hypothetical protein ASL20_24770 [Cupriavidus necator]